VGLERGPLSLAITTEELLETKNSGSGLENRDRGRRDPPRWPRETSPSAKVGTNYADKRLSLGMTVGILRSQTKATKFVSLYHIYIAYIKKIPWSEPASELYRPSNRRLSAKLLPTCADRECHVVSVMDPSGRILSVF
jgi:hypothetical protein